MFSEIKECQNCNNQFTIEPEDFAFYEKMKVPAPTFCPDCRYQRRLANRNEWNFYKDKCGLCGNDMVSIYNSEYPGPVYCQPCWWGDGWDSFACGQEFDFSRLCHLFVMQILFFESLSIEIVQIGNVAWGK